jgi:hypothetical protein
MPYGSKVRALLLSVPPSLPLPYSLSLAPTLSLPPSLSPSPSVPPSLPPSLPLPYSLSLALAPTLTLAPSLALSLAPPFTLSPGVNVLYALLSALSVLLSLTGSTLSVLLSYTGSTPSLALLSQCYSLLHWLFLSRWLCSSSAALSPTLALLSLAGSLCAAASVVPLSRTLSHPLPLPYTDGSGPIRTIQVLGCSLSLALLSMPLSLTGSALSLTLLSQCCSLLLALLSHWRCSFALSVLLSLTASHTHCLFSHSDEPMWCRRGDVEGGPVSRRLLGVCGQPFVALYTALGA